MLTFLQHLEVSFGLFGPFMTALRFLMKFTDYVSTINFSISLFVLYL